MKQSACFRWCDTSCWWICHVTRIPNVVVSSSDHTGPRCDWTSGHSLFIVGWLMCGLTKGKSQCDLHVNRKSECSHWLHAALLQVVDCPSGKTANSSLCHPVMVCIFHWLTRAHRHRQSRTCADFTCSSSNTLLLLVDAVLSCHIRLEAFVGSAG